MAQSYRKLNRLAEAVACYDKILAELKKKDTVIIVLKAITLAEMLNTTAALECYNEALEIDPNNIYAN